jgi:nicotinate-nucleotide adenylyltransferase
VRIGLLGGSFDPPHNGHLLAAGDAYEALALDRLIFVPAAVQPLKGSQAAGTPVHRLAMTRLLADGDARFGVDSIEIDRGGLSYTVDTLSALAARWPPPEHMLFWLVGGDVPRSFAKWREPERIVQLATVVVLQRANGGDAGTKEARHRGGLVADVTSMPGAPQVLATRRVDISSTEIRQRVREGRSIRGFVPDAVAQYIAAERLYR